VARINGGKREQILGFFYVNRVCAQAIVAQFYKSSIKTHFVDFASEHMEQF